MRTMSNVDSVRLFRAEANDESHGLWERERDRVSVGGLSGSTTGDLLIRPKDREGKKREGKRR